MNVNTKKGKAWQNGNEVTDPAKLDELMKRGYGRFINDTYWLLMPIKMLDPGVHRASEGEKTDTCGHVWDVVRLSFDQGVGLTPADVYWAWVNRDSGLVDQWDMRLTFSTPEDPPSVVKFHDFHRIGGLLLSTRRAIAGKNHLIRLDHGTV